LKPRGRRLRVPKVPGTSRCQSRSRDIIGLRRAAWGGRSPMLKGLASSQVGIIRGTSRHQVPEIAKSSTCSHTTWEDIGGILFNQKAMVCVTNPLRPPGPLCRHIAPYLRYTPAESTMLSLERASPAVGALSTPSTTSPLRVPCPRGRWGQRRMAMRAARECDVAIIGAGPGGLTTAIALRQALPGIRVEVFDKASRFDPAGEPPCGPQSVSRRRVGET